MVDEKADGRLDHRRGARHQRDGEAAQDVDGKFFAKGLSDNGRQNASFWYDFKFVNPATKKIQVKDQYCESLNETVVCAGVYRP